MPRVEQPGQRLRFGGADCIAPEEEEGGEEEKRRNAIPQWQDGSGSFHDLVRCLTDEYERLSAQNGVLHAENERLRGRSAPHSRGRLDSSSRDDGNGDDASSACSGSIGNDVPVVKFPNDRDMVLLSQCKEKHGEHPQRPSRGSSSSMSSSPESFADRGLYASDTSFLREGRPTTASSELGQERLGVRARSGARKSARMSIKSFGTTLSAHSTHGRRLGAGFVKVFLFLEDPDSSRAGLWYGNFMQCLILASVALPLAQTVDGQPLRGTHAAVLEICFELIFIAEVSTRFVVNPARRVFLHSTFNLIDMASLVTLALRVAAGFGLPRGKVDSLVGFVLLCVVPVVRLLKLLRRWETIHLLTKAFIDVFEALPVLLFPLFVLTLSFASLIYVVEAEDNIASLPQAVWFTIVTMTTVGYGDVVPQSSMGSVVVGVLVISSLIYMAMPLAIVGSSFTQVWQEREIVLLMHRTRARLTKWGYTAFDIAALFNLFDKSHSGNLNISEFSTMFKTMKLCVHDDKVLQLFRLFDDDGSGCVDDKEFVRVVYPEKFLTVYGSAAEGQEEEEDRGMARC